MGSNFEDFTTESPGGGDSTDGSQQQSSAADSEEARLQQALYEYIADVNQPTRQLHMSDLSQLLGLDQQAFGVRSGVTSMYTLLPTSISEDEVSLSSPLWRIELHGLKPEVPLGFDIVADVTVGRGSNVDLDLEPYGGERLGVSRRHAILRPTAKGLYVLDLNSTNGTMINALPLGPGITRGLSNDDTLSFSNLSCTVKIISSPILRAGMAEEQNPD